MSDKQFIPKGKLDALAKERDYNTTKVAGNRRLGARNMADAIARAADAPMPEGIERPKAAGYNHRYFARASADRLHSYLRGSDDIPRDAREEQAAVNTAALHAASSALTSLAIVLAGDQGAITEEEGRHKVWADEAREQTLASLPAFLAKLNAYEHDYGTIVHAMTAAALGAIFALDKGPNGGVTGFQAQCLMWEFIRHWMHAEGPLRLVQVRDMLYPNNAEKFASVLSKESADWLRTQAATKLEEIQKSDKYIHETVLEHWRGLAAGAIPYGWTVEQEQAGPESGPVPDCDPGVQAVLDKMDAAAGNTAGE